MNVLAYLLSCRRAPGCFQVLAIIKCSEHSCTRLLVGMFSFSLGQYLGIELLDHMVDTGLLSRELPSFPRGLYNFTLLPAMYERSGCLGHAAHAWDCQSFFISANLMDT